jgi:hypothetical protein
MIKLCNVILEYCQKLKQFIICILPFKIHVRLYYYMQYVNIRWWCCCWVTRGVVWGSESVKRNETGKENGTEREENDVNKSVGVRSFEETAS